MSMGKTVLTSALFDGADAEPSKWLYNWLSTSRSLLTLFLFGWIKIAWKFTGNPYLKCRIVRKTNVRREKSQWNLFQNLPQNGFNEYTKCLNVNPCTECFAEVHFQPTDKWALHKEQTKCVMRIRIGSMNQAHNWGGGGGGYRRIDGLICGPKMGNG